MSVPALKDSALSVEGQPKKEEGSFFEMNVDKADLGRPESLRYRVLTWVLDEQYDRAIEGLREFAEAPSEYPNFQSKVGRFVNHSVDLIYAIKAKRSFPGINSLTRAKQQELREKFKEHFRELQHVLKVVEKVQGDLRIQDVRSTIYIVRAAWYAGLAIAILGFWLEIVNGLAVTSAIVLDDTFGNLADWLASMIGM